MLVIFIFIDYFWERNAEITFLLSIESLRNFVFHHWFSTFVVADDFNMNAVMRLNQYRPGLEFRLITQTGPVHEPVFTMAVELLGKTYEASGPSKKVAKLNVATKARLELTR